MPEATTDVAIKPAAALKPAARTLQGVDPAAVTAFVEALTAASERLSVVADRLEAARVHDEAFGKLIDADKIREAYHARLPATEHNLAEARDVIDHFLAEFAADRAA